MMSSELLSLPPPCSAARRGAPGEDGPVIGCGESLHAAMAATSRRRGVGRRALIMTGEPRATKAGGREKERGSRICRPGTEKQVFVSQVKSVLSPYACIQSALGRRFLA